MMAGLINRREEFSSEVEIFIRERRTSVMEAIIAIALRKGIELEVVGKIISVGLKEKLQAEAEDLNLMKDKPVKLMDLQE
jgi:hypothetical protein